MVFTGHDPCQNEIIAATSAASIFFEQNAGRSVQKGGARQPSNGNPAKTRNIVHVHSGRLAAASIDYEDTSPNAKTSVS